MENVVHFPPPSPTPSPPAKKRGLKPGRNPWPGVSGGFIHLAKDETLSFYAVRKVDGERFGPVMLGHDAEIAMKNYREWWPNPRAWNPAGTAPADAVYLDTDLIKRYAKWCAAIPPGKKKRPRNRDTDWIQGKVNKLVWWITQLHGRNLRSDRSPGCVTTDDLHVMLAGTPDYRGKLVALRALYRFLREATAAELPVSMRVLEEHDPVRKIPVPGGEPAQASESKVEWTKEDSDKVIAWLKAQVSSCGHGGTGYAVPRQRQEGKTLFNTKEAGAYLGLTEQTVWAYAARGKIKHDGGGHGRELVFRRSQLDAFEKTRERGPRDTAYRVALALTVLGGTHAHAREIARFSQDPDALIVDLPAEYKRQHGAAKALVVDHKIGKPHPIPVTARAAEAAAELRQLGGVRYTALFTWTKKAVEATGAARFAPGRFRHRGATLGLHRGASRKDVGAMLGHENEKTTGIYTMLAVPAKQPTWY